MAGTVPHLPSMCPLGIPLVQQAHTLLCDNKAVVSIINTKTSKIPRIMDLLRPITLFTLQHTGNFTLTAVHVPGLQNGIADSLSRFQMERFRELAPEASPTGYPIPPSLIHI